MVAVLVGGDRVSIFNRLEDDDEIAGGDFPGPSSNGDLHDGALHRGRSNCIQPDAARPPAWDAAGFVAALGFLRTTPGLRPTARSAASDGQVSPGQRQPSSRRPADLHGRRFCPREGCPLPRSGFSTGERLDGVVHPPFRSSGCAR